VFPQTAHPETLLYSYLTVPRFAVPRWYAEGSAVFMETWMDGGLGRAQSGFYEMVFRAMVRDDAPVLRSRWARIARHPRRLPGRRQRLSLRHALLHLAGPRAHAGEGDRVAARDEGGRRHYADQFEHVFGITLERAWQDWIEFERGFQRRNLEQVRRHPITPHKDLVPTAVGSVSRAFHDEARGVLYAGFDYQGTVAHIGALSLKDGSVRNLADIKDALLYKVTSLAFDPASRTAFFTIDHHAMRDILALNVDTGAERCCSRTRASARSCSTRPTSRCSACATRTVRHPRAHPASVHRVEPGPHVPLWRRALRPRRLGPTGDSCPRRSPR
jgi:hypothetical protein